MVATLLLVASTIAANQFHPPIYNITASSLYDAGKQHGAQAKERIQGWFQSDEIGELRKFAVEDPIGIVAYEQLRTDSTEAFPQYADELRGIAEGAEVTLDMVWTGILMIELQNLMNKDAVGQRTATHCTDISAVAEGGYRNGFGHGHNEDWSKAVGELYYYIKYTAAPGVDGSAPDFASCAGLAYPGALIGWAPTWNAHGIFMTVNTLYPRTIKMNGVSTSFIQREALCGVGKGRTLADVATGLASPAWACGASLNLVDTVGGVMGNVETYEDTNDILIVTEEMGNSSHFNMYKRLPVREHIELSSIQRQWEVNLMPPARTTDDIATILSQIAILRQGTIGSLIVDQTGRLSVWAGNAPARADPLYSWNVLNFFDAEDHGHRVGEGGAATRVITKREDAHGS